MVYRLTSRRVAKGCKRWVWFGERVFWRELSLEPEAVGVVESSFLPIPGLCREDSVVIVLLSSRAALRGVRNVGLEVHGGFV